MRTPAVSAAALCSALAASARAQPLIFTDRTAASGLTCSHALDPASGPQMMAAGGACGDFNNDGWQDLFVLGGYGRPGARDRLFINNRDGTFSEQAAAWGVARTHRGTGIAVGDYNNDGWLDIFITTEAGPGAYSFNILYRNNGNGTFTDVAAAAGLATAPGRETGGGWGVAFGDYDLDGRLDIAITDWTNPAGGNGLYHNNGDGTFTDVTAQALGTSLVGSQGFGARFIDMDGDRWPELLFTCDFGRSRYLRNNRDGTFTNLTAPAGVGLDGNGMGSSVADLDGDGRPDWFVTSIFDTSPQPNQPGTGNMLYMNLGGHHFAETSQAAGVKQGGWGWGSIAADLDHDGRIDLSHTNGWPQPEFASDQTCVFRNAAAPAGPLVFQQLAPACGITHTGQGRGMLAFDYDNDGDQDLVIFTNDGPLTLYRNDSPAPGTHFLRALLDTRARPGLAPNGYGAHITASTGALTRHAWLCGGSNFLSQSELSAHFGLGASTRIDTLRVEWPDGRVSTSTDVAADRTVILRACPADFNRDGITGIQDLFDFLAGYFAADPNADTNLSGAVTVQDIFEFLAAWFAGCA